MKIITSAKILRKKSQNISKITPQIKRLIKEMAKTLKENNGVGLAAPQVGEFLRLFIVEIPKTDYSPGFPLTVFINPQIKEKSKEIKTDEEGCLSLPNIWGQVPRYQKIKVEALNEKGEKFSLFCEDFLARVIQHEIDHLDGILFIDRINDFSSLYQINEKGEKVPLIQL
jgi:peptide deformylase